MGGSSFIILYSVILGSASIVKQFAELQIGIVTATVF